MFKRSIASEIASGMDQVLESSEHKSMFSSPTLNKFAAKKKEDEKAKKDDEKAKKSKKEDKKEDKKDEKKGKGKADKNDCGGPMGKDKGKVKVIKMKKADALRIAVDGISKISAVLDEAGLTKGSLATLAALDTLVKEAQEAVKEDALEPVRPEVQEAKEVWNDLKEFGERDQTRPFGYDADLGLADDSEDSESFEDFFKSVVGDEEVKDAFVESAKKELAEEDEGEANDSVVELPEAVITPEGEGDELSDKEQEELMKTLEEMKEEIDAETSMWGDL